MALIAGLTAQIEIVSSALIYLRKMFFRTIVVLRDGKNIFLVLFSPTQGPERFQ